MNTCKECREITSGDCGKHRINAENIGNMPQQYSECITPYDFRGNWADIKDKEVILKQINEKVSNILQEEIRKDREELQKRITEMRSYHEPTDYGRGYNQAIAQILELLQ